MKLCTDCKYRFGGFGYSFCDHPNVPRSPVDGWPVGDCNDHRVNGGCGKDAAWFESRQVETPRKTWFARIFRG